MLQFIVLINELLNAHFPMRRTIAETKNPCRPNERQGFHLFEILCLLFAGLLIEHKLYITLLLILMPLVLLRRILALIKSGT